MVLYFRFFISQNILADSNDKLHFCQVSSKQFTKVSTPWKSKRHGNCMQLWSQTGSCCYKEHCWSNWRSLNRTWELNVEIYECWFLEFWCFTFFMEEKICVLRKSTKDLGRMRYHDGKLKMVQVKIKINLCTLSVTFL